MACGCGGSNPGAASDTSSGALLTGYLSGDAVDGTPSADSGGIAAADVGGGISAEFAMLHSGGFWLLVVLIIGTAWYLDSKKSGDE